MQLAPAVWAEESLLKAVEIRQAHCSFPVKSDDLQAERNESWRRSWQVLLFTSAQGTDKHGA